MDVSQTKSSGPREGWPVTQVRHSEQKSNSDLCTPSHPVVYKSFWIFLVETNKSCHLERKRKKMLGLLAANPEEPSPCLPAQLASPLPGSVRQPAPRPHGGDGAQDTVWLGRPIPTGSSAAEGAGGPATAGSPGRSLRGALGQATVSWAPSGHNKAPFSRGTRPRSEPPSGSGTRRPHSVPFNGRLCAMWARLFSCVGSFRGAGQAEEPRSPEEKGALEPGGEGGGLLPGAGPSVPGGHRGPGHAVTEALRALGRGLGAAPPPGSPAGSWASP